MGGVAPTKGSDSNPEILLLPVRLVRLGGLWATTGLRKTNASLVPTTAGEQKTHPAIALVMNPECLCHMHVRQAHKVRHKGVLNFVCTTPARRRKDAHSNRNHQIWDLSDTAEPQGAERLEIT